MSWTKNIQSTRSLVYAIAVVSLAAAGLWIGVQNNPAEASTTTASSNAVPAATFAADAATLGAIPDGAAGCAPSPGAARNVTFTTSGLSGNVTAVDISMTFGAPMHTFVGDIVAVLIAPNGASHNVFARTLATAAAGFGGSANLVGPYVFSDTAPAPPSGGWWQEANARTSAEAITAGTYRTTASGGAGATIPMPPTSMNPSFTGVANANGTWTLRLTDGCASDTGAISAANLSVTTGTPQVFDANTDFNGDGKTDFVVARATTTPLTEATAPGLSSISKMSRRLSGKRNANRSSKTESENLLAPPIYWYSSINGSGVTGVGQLGDAATDYVLTEDFDGDLKDDLVVWTEAPATQANFKILQSSTNTVQVVTFGQQFDDPTVVGDYDGDGKADPAVYRCPTIAQAAGQCYFYYRGSLNNPSGNITYVPWGVGNDGDFFPAVGDFDGDGKSDFCLQRSNPSQAGKGQFVLLKSNGFGIEYINWGLDSDFVAPGDYDGDGKTDFCVIREVGANLVHYILTRTGATSQVTWGLGDDVPVPGDYDGDGKTDIAIWRGSTDQNQNYYWILNSSNGAISQFEWGQCPTGNCDYPVANWAVH